MIFQLKPIKLSKRQRCRIKYNSKHKSTSNKEFLLCSNEMVSIILYILNYLKRLKKIHQFLEQKHENFSSNTTKLRISVKLIINCLFLLNLY